MIAHMILVKPKPDMTPEDRQAVLDGLRAAASGIASIRRLRVGRRVRHGRPGYEQLMRDDFEYAVIVEFDNLEGLTAYLSHPHHTAIGSYFTNASSSALAYDYEMEEWK
jgi:hypothetical protein